MNANYPFEDDLHEMSILKNNILHFMQIVPNVSPIHFSIILIN